MGNFRLPRRSAKVLMRPKAGVQTGIFAVVFSITAFATLAIGLALAWQHPLWPTIALIAFYGWTVIALWRPVVWLFVVPACLPILNFWPWTGWQAFDEFDLLLLGTLAAGYTRLAWESRGAAVADAPVPSCAGRPRVRLFLALTMVAALASLVKGFVAAGVFEAGFDWALAPQQAMAYESPLNGLRIFKSLGFAVLFYPLLGRETRTPGDSARAQAYFGNGMLVGLAIVTLVSLWERAAYPGLLEFSTRYRTTALFWEMHVGGAAIDGYLALATPFLGWALWSTRRPAVWFALALLAILTCYAVLTSFSRGVYLAVGAPLIVLALFAIFRQLSSRLPAAERLLGAPLKSIGWRGKAGVSLTLALVVEVAAVMWGGTFLLERVGKTDADLVNRIEHWQRGLSLLQTPLDWALGKGLGRLPAEYAQISDDTEFSGAVRLETQQANPALAGGERSGPSAVSSPYQVKLSGPQDNPELAGLFSLTQRVDFDRRSTYAVNLTVRAIQEADIRLKVCEKHMIYEGSCHYRFFKLKPVNETWQQLNIPLRGRAQGPRQNVLPRFGVFSISVINAGGALELQNIQLLGATGQDLLANGDFSHGLAHWLGAAQSYYLPWHIDNLYLELLIERGAAGLLLTALLALAAVRGLVSRASSGTAQARFLLASLAGAALIGLVSSLMDAPRVAFLIHLVLLFTMQLARGQKGARK